MSGDRGGLRGARRIAGAGICACTAAVVLAACGGGGSTSSTAVARVGDTAISQGFLGQWMTERVGEDFYLAERTQAPVGLVSEPENLPRCVAAARAWAASVRTKARPASTLSRTCKELYGAIRRQALAYLVSSYWALDFYAKYGIAVTSAEVQRAFDSIKAREYPGPGEFEHVMALRRRTVAQELFTIRNDLVEARVRKLLTAGGPKLFAAVTERAESGTDSASCPPGYIVEHCEGFQPPREQFARSDAGAPATLIGELAP